VIYPRGRPTATRRRYGRDATGRQCYQALQELQCANGHVIAAGEVFTVTTRTSGVTDKVQSNVPLCGDCREVVLR
jgi:hypothetical protein